MKIMTDEWLPFVTKQIKARHGWDSFYYGIASTPGAGGFGGGGGARGRGREGAPGGPPAGAAPPRRLPCQNVEPAAGVTREWRTVEHVPRFHNSYVGLPNRFGLLSEPYAYATFEDRIKATNYFLEAALDFANQHAAMLKKAIADADRAKVDAAVLATTAKFKRGGMVDILMGEVEPGKNPVSGQGVTHRKDAVKSDPLDDRRDISP